MAINLTRDKKRTTDDFWKHNLPSNIGPGSIDMGRSQFEKKKDAPAAFDTSVEKNVLKVKPVPGPGTYSHSAERVVPKVDEKSNNAFVTKVSSNNLTHFFRLLDSVRHNQVVV